MPTVAQPYDQIAKTVVDVLMKKINGEKLEKMSYIIPISGRNMPAVSN